jgi:hypothetical protein
MEMTLKYPLIFLRRVAVQVLVFFFFYTLVVHGFLFKQNKQTNKKTPKNQNLTRMILNPSQAFIFLQNGTVKRDH